MDDQRAIEHLLYRYAELIDAGDFTGIGQLFARGQIVAPAAVHPFRGADEVRQMYEMSTRRYPDGRPHTQHVMSNVRIDVAADRLSADAKLRFTVFQAHEDFPLQPIVAGRYEDRFARDDSGWFFSERRMLTELIGDLSRHLLIELPRRGS